MRGLADSGARWNVLAQQIFFARLDYQGGDEQRFTMDAWDGYADSHDRIVDFVARRGWITHRPYGKRSRQLGKRDPDRLR